VKPRRCSRAACGAPAVSTLTYAYADSTAVLGPLAPYVEPHTYDLCSVHAGRLTVPRGWDVVLVEQEPDEAQRSSDDLEALANAVREAARPAAPAQQEMLPGVAAEVTRRGHLRAIPSS
jgi:hypothetical protein